MICPIVYLKDENIAMVLVEMF